MCLCAVLFLLLLSGRWTECVHLLEWEPVYGTMHGILVWKCVHEHYQPISIKEAEKKREPKKEGKPSIAWILCGFVHSTAHAVTRMKCGVTRIWFCAGVCYSEPNSVQIAQNLNNLPKKISCRNEGKKLDFDDVVERAECIENERQQRLLYSDFSGEAERIGAAARKAPCNGAGEMQMEEQEQKQQR